jgi:hypothetical protein
MKLRKVFFAIYLILPALIVILLHEEIFKISVDPKDWSIYNRLWWCFSCALFGFDILILKSIIRDLKLRKDDIDPKWTYSIFYPLIIAITSTIPFFIFNIWASSLSTLFFAGAGSFSFFLGFYVDSFYNIFLRIIPKIGY